MKSGLRFRSCGGGSDIWGNRLSGLKSETRVSERNAGALNNLKEKWHNFIEIPCKI